jgi:type IV pilus assembly protein PilQ
MKNRINTAVIASPERSRMAKQSRSTMGLLRRSFHSLLAMTLFACLSTASLAEDAQKISLNLMGAPLNTVIYALGKEAGLNIVASDDIQGTVTIAVNEVSPYDALVAVLQASGFSYRKEGEIMQITVPAMRRLAGEQLFSKSGLMTKAFIVNNLAAADVEDLIKRLGYTDARILSAKGSNMLVVEAPPEIMEKIDSIFKRLDASPRQVLVESQILEITAGNAATPNVLGAQGRYVSSSYDIQTEGLANPAVTGVSGFYAHVIRGNVEAYVEALENKEGYSLLAHPKVIAVSGKPANIISGSKLGYMTTTTTTTGTTQNVDFLEVGTKLSFTPYVYSDGTIRMDIHPEVSEGSITTDGLPQKQTTEATTTVLVRDGETIVIGGLIKDKTRETEKGVPIVMHIPVIGNLFKRKEILWEKKEIIAVITPHIINNERAKEMLPRVEKLKQQQKESGIGEEPGVMWWVK